MLVTIERFELPRGISSNQFCRLLPSTTRPYSHYFLNLWYGAESNRRHSDFQSDALPTELPHHSTSICQRSFYIKNKILHSPCCLVENKEFNFVIILNYYFYRSSFRINPLHQPPNRLEVLIDICEILVIILYCNIVLYIIIIVYCTKNFKNL